MHKINATAPAPSVSGDMFTEKGISLGAGKLPPKVTTMLPSLHCETQGFRVKLAFMAYTSSEILLLVFLVSVAIFLATISAMMSGMILKFGILIGHLHTELLINKRKTQANLLTFLN